MLNIVLPLAGRGSRFAAAGYSLPRPLILIHGEPLVATVVRNVRPQRPHRFTFLALKDHLAEHPLRATLERAAPGCAIVAVDHVTEGDASTVLLARDLIDSCDPLMVVNSGQWVDVDIEDYLDAMDRTDADGLVMTMKTADPKWSFVGLDGRGRVSRVVAKAAISDEAIVGVYNFRRGSDFVGGADRMIARNSRVDDEFCISPVFNELLRDSARIVTYTVGSEGAGMFGFGTPEDLTRFLAHPISRRAVDIAA